MASLHAKRNSANSPGVLRPPRLERQRLPGDGRRCAGRGRGRRGLPPSPTRSRRRTDDRPARPLARREGDAIVIDRPDRLLDRTTSRLPIGRPCIRVLCSAQQTRAVRRYRPRRDIGLPPERALTLLPEEMGSSHPPPRCCLSSARVSVAWSETERVRSSIAMARSKKLPRYSFPLSSRTPVTMW